MKKLTLMAIAMGMLAFTACTEKKPAAAPAAQVEEVVTDSAFQQAVAGEYKSADGKRIITVNADFTVKTTGLDKDYFKWDMDVKPQGPSANINLIRKAFLDRTVAIWAGSTRGSRSTLLGCNFLCSLLVDISMSLLDHPYSKLPQLFKVVWSIIDVAPLKAEPLDVLEDIFYVFVVFLTWVGVIKSEVADTLVFFGYTEVHADGLGVTDVKVAVRLWWKTGLDSTSVLTFLEVFLN
jgi:hypothetical protein